VQNALSALTKWIPGDAIAFYLAAVSAFTVAADKEPSVVLLLIWIFIATPALVFVGAMSSGTISGKTVIAAALAAGAFAIWSVAVPAGGWQKWSFISDNPGGAAVVAGFVALLYAGVADWISKNA
jgi:hypothetical protein